MDRYNMWTPAGNLQDSTDMFAWRNQVTGSASTSGIADIFGNRPARTAAPERNFMDRVLAPFEAPQQFLYRMTQEVDKDGFQFSDVWTSLSHGASYFNPFGNTERISEDTIRQTLFGPDAAGATRTFRTSAINLGISLLYDPMWFVPAIGLARKGAAGAVAAGRMTAETATGIGRMASVAERIADPGMAAMDIFGWAGRGAGKVTQNLIGKAIGPDQAADLSVRVRQMFVNKNAGLEAMEIEKLGRYQMGLKEWQQRATAIYTEGRKLSPDTQGLVTRMLESNAVHTSRFNPDMRLRPKQKAEIGSLLAEAKAKGIDENLLWDVYSRAAKLEMDILDDLVRTQRIPMREARELYGRHIRRVYTVFDNPTDGLERIDRLIQAGDPVAAQYRAGNYMFDAPALRKALSQADDALQLAMPTKVGKRYNAATATPGAPTFSAQTRYNRKGTTQSGARDYFETTADGARRLNTEAFVDDLGGYLNQNPLATMDDALEHIKEEMFHNSIDNPEFFKTLGNYMSNGRVKTKGIDDWKEIFLQGKASTSTNFRAYREQIEHIAEREAIPEYIRKEILGQPDSYLPGIIDDAVVAAREVEITDLLDGLSGAKRVGSDIAEKVMQLGDNPEEMVRMLTQDAGLSQNQANDIYRLVTEGKDVDFKNIYGMGDSEWSSVGRTERHTYRLPESDKLGSMSGRYVSPGMGAHIDNLERMLKIGMTRPEGIWQWFGDKMSGVTSQFKFLKIVADAGANFRDTVGSLIQMDVIGGTPFKANNIRKAFNSAQDWMNGTSNIYTEAARRIGYPLMDSGFSAGELQRLSRSAAEATVLRAEKTWADEGLTLFERFKTKTAELQGRASNLYQFRENVMRSYVFIGKYDELAENMARAGTNVLLPEIQEGIARQAASITDRSLFNYADVPYAVDFARKYGIAPFLTFPFKAVPQLVESLYTNPLRVLKYDRVVNGWNEHWAGGSDAFAQEVAALPEHKRQAMVIRLPGEDKDGHPLYMDLSYFIPWFAVRDLAKDAGGALNLFKDPSSDVEESRGAIAGDTGMRSSIFTPLFFQLTQAFGNNMDGLGRPIVGPSDSTEERFKKWGRYLYQFMAPPTFIGGTTADSVGRAMQAVARTSPEPMDWLNFVGTSVRTGFNRGETDVLNRFGERPTTRATAGGSALGGGLEGMFGVDLNPNVDAAVGALEGLFLNVSSSDPRRQVRNERIQTTMSNTELQRLIAQVRSNENMPRERKRKEIDRLRQMIRDNTNAARSNIRDMRGQ